MTAKATEKRHERAVGLDTLAAGEAASILFETQLEASNAVRGALDGIVRASQLAAHTLREGGRLFYAGAGSSGLMAMADALELPGTYGIEPDRIVILLAGGPASLATLSGGVEDDEAAARADLVRNAIRANDCVIAVSASGSTPYTQTIVEAAASAGAPVVAVANNAGAVIFDGASVSILLATPPEPVAGSTRMGAGTAQKIALNMLSTLTGIRLGHVHDGYMVNVHADNAKLRARAGAIVSAIAGVGADEGAGWLDKAEGSVKHAVLMASGAGDRSQADGWLRQSDYNLRRALAAVSQL